MAKATFSLRTALRARREITNNTIVAIRELYIRAADRLQAILDKQPLSDEPTDSLNAAPIRSFARATEEELDRISRSLAPLILAAMAGASRASVQAHTNFAMSIGMPVSNPFLGVTASSVKRVATGQIYNRPFTLSGAIWGHNQADHRTVLSIVDDGIRNHMSAADIAESIQGFVDPRRRRKLDIGRVYPGSNRRVEYNAFRLARTEIAHCYRITNDECLKPNPFVEAEQWVVSNSHRVCDLCTKISQTDEYQLGDGVFPKGEAPLDHPNGMCILVPIMPWSMEDLSNRLADYVKGRGGNGLGVSDDEIAVYGRILLGKH